MMKVSVTSDPSFKVVLPYKLSVSIKNLPIFRLLNLKTDSLFWAYLSLKLLCDVAFWTLLQYDTVTYSFDFNLAKWLLGLIWCLVLYASIRHDERLVSTFFLYLILVTQIVPITTIYALSNENSLFYNLTCLSYLVTILIVNYIKPPFQIVAGKWISLCFVGTLLLLCLYMLFATFQLRGWPTLANLNLYDIYKFRRAFPISDKLLGYVMRFSTQVFLPVFVTISVLKKKYKYSLFFLSIIFLMFLYTGHKSFLFSIPLVLVCALFAERPNFYKEFYIFLTLFFLLAVIGAFYSEDRDILNMPFSMVMRRVLILPANLKFIYYDYFTNYEKIGLYGLFPRFLLEVSSRYSTVPYTFDISAIYFNKPLMNANTGYLAEGYMRFGYIGIFMEAFILGWIFQMMDFFQKRTDYALTIGFFTYAVFSLNDAHLLDQLVFGPWLFIVIIIVLFPLSLFRNRSVS